MEEDGTRWKKMEEDGGRWTEKKSSKKAKQKCQTKICLESAGDGLGTLVGVQRVQKTYYSD